MNRRANTFIRQLGQVTVPPVGLRYGRLYNQHAFLDANFAPTGWHIPTYSELTALSTYLGGDSVSGGKLKETGTVYWSSPNTGATNESGFSGRGTGYRIYAGDFLNINSEMIICTSTLAAPSPHVIVGRLKFDSAEIYIFSFGTGERYGYPVRFIKNTTTLSNGQTSTMNDYDGNTYTTICIGTQEWTAQNWICTKLNNGISIPEVTINASWAALTTGAWCYYANDPNNL